MYILKKNQCLQVIYLQFYHCIYMQHKPLLNLAYMSFGIPRFFLKDSNLLFLNIENKIVII